MTHKPAPTNAEAPKAAFTTLGCKVNQYETQRIIDTFAESGFQVVSFDEPADLYVVNSCSVTSQAEAKSRYVVRRAKRTNPHAKVVVTGCAAQMAINKGELIEGADALVPNPTKLQTLGHTLADFPQLAPGPHAHPSKPPLALGRTRATLKIQDGCNVMCSYCSIPFTRPGMVSRPWQEVLAEAQRLAAQGFHEAVLTGVLIGAYGPESGSEGPNFERLVRIISEESGLARIRISSIEMHQLTDPILDLAESGCVVPHFHIPLQSGDTQVLKDMNRRYDRDMFVKTCEKVKSRLKNSTVTTDIMVGFPTETDQSFESTLELCQTVRFLKAHVFRFSPRHGTPADTWGDPVPPETKQERAKTLASLTGEIASSVVRSFVNTTQRVLVERRDHQGLLEGTSDNWLTVRFPGPDSMVKTLQHVRLTEEEAGVAFGELAKEPAPNLLTVRS